MKTSSIDVGLNTANGILEQTVICLQIYANAVYANSTLMVISHSVSKYGQHKVIHANDHFHKLSPIPRSG